MAAIILDDSQEYHDEVHEWESNGGSTGRCICGEMEWYRKATPSGGTLRVHYRYTYDYEDR